MQAIILEGYIDIPSDSSAAVEQILNLHIQEMAARAGCLSFNMTPSPDIPHRFLACGKFKDQAAVNTHFQTPDTTEWFNLTKGLARIYVVSRED